mmetsp:Transcript_9946/g.22399  ORF Transcript_9946/g.22399 Transcript_9946/m.22399 type:complete len:83 (+) Transcript_9946:2-250(+)
MWQGMQGVQGVQGHPGQYQYPSRGPQGPQGPHGPQGMAPGMLPHNAERKSIPDANGGFAFMNGGAKPTGDFSFVTDAMRSQK